MGNFSARYAFYEGFPYHIFPPKSESESAEFEDLPISSRDPIPRQCVKEVKIVDFSC